MTVNTNGAKVSDPNRIVSETGMLAIMAKCLYEGDIGEQFQKFAFSNTALGAHIVKDALTKYRANQTFWPSVGAFALNYLTTALRVVEPHVPLVVNTSDMTANQRKACDEIRYEQLWETWAEFCMSFSIGS